MPRTSAIVDHLEYQVNGVSRARIGRNDDGGVRGVRVLDRHRPSIGAGLDILPPRIHELVAVRVRRASDEDNSLSRLRRSSLSWRALVFVDAWSRGHQRGHHEADGLVGQSVRIAKTVVAVGLVKTWLCQWTCGTLAKFGKLPSVDVTVSRPGSAR